MTKDKEWINSLEDIKEPRQRAKYSQSIFPPPNVEEYPLERW